MNTLERIQREQAESTAKRIGQVHLNAKLQALQEILDEVKTEGYQDINEVLACINGNIGIFNKIKQEQK